MFEIISNLGRTLFAIGIALLVIRSVYGLTFYIWEMGSEEGKKHMKGILLDSVSALMFLMLLYMSGEYIVGIIESKLDSAQTIETSL